MISKTTINAEKLALDLQGSGNMNLSVNTTNIEATIIGSGDIVLEGKAENFIGMVKGSGDIKATKLEAEKATLEVKGSGNINTVVKKELTATILGSGDIEVGGKPAHVNKSVRGSGNVVLK